MNGMSTPVKKLSGASVVSIIFGIIFAIAAACMVFLPTVSISSRTLRVVSSFVRHIR